MTALIDLPVEDPAARVPKRKNKSGGSLGKYLAIRFVLIFPTIFILVTMVFFLMRLTGDPISAALGDRLPPDQLAIRVHEAGYDRPLFVQYLEYLGQIATGNFGRTISDNLLISDMLASYGTATLELAINSLVVALAIGIPVGMLAAYKRDKWQDAISRVLAIAFYATPVFFCRAAAEAGFRCLVGLVARGRTRLHHHRNRHDATRGAHRNLLAGCVAQWQYERFLGRCPTLDSARCSPRSAHRRDLPAPGPHQCDWHTEQGLC